MILKHLSVCGFRGIKKVLELPLSAGFVVVAGRNGTGKSTLCDAIEFALTGRFRTSQHKEKGESITDYIWWRGTGDPEDRFVRLILQSPEGKEITIERTPSGLKLEGAKKLDEALCDITSAPSEPIERLCRTSIIRDEEITNLSVDLAETDRFDFVRLALGTTDFAELEERAKNVNRILEEQHRQTQTTYASLRTSVSDLTARLSAARSEVTNVADVGPAEDTIRLLIQRPTESPRELLALATKEIPDRRVRVDQLIRLIERLRRLEVRLQQIRTPAHSERLIALQSEVASLGSQLSEAETEMSGVEAEMAKQRQQQPRMAALATLHQSGEQLGLQEGGQCPLCGSALSPSTFAAHLSAVQATIRAGSDETLKAARRRAELQQNRVSLRQRISTAEEQLLAAQAAEGTIKRELAEVNALALNLGVPAQSQPLTAQRLSERVEELRASGSALERAVATLEASRSFERITKLEAELQALQITSESAERTMESVGNGVQRAKNAVAIIRRVRGEMIDESLAELSPLLSELYLRLRPHVDWQEITYHLRGDVRKFLSFKVGNDLNPSFVFSSGQRRAAGMAFLLAVYLARPWCRLKTLILDDPVQHVDDFRALNLTEVLAAIRRSGRQIICTTEDAALAELMARRLRSGDINDGLLVEMGHDSTSGVHVAASRRIGPFSANVLVPA